MPSKYRQRPRDTARMLWIKSLPCCAPGITVLSNGVLDRAPAIAIGPCDGVTEADHAGGGSGTGRKCDDSLIIPLCVRHHRAPGLEHLLYGLVPHGEVRRWKRWQAEQYRMRYDALEATRDE